MKKNWRLVLAVVLFFGVLLFFSSFSFAAGKTVKIGGFCPLTGPHVDNGTEVKRGIELAVTLQNESGGVKIGDEKYQIELVWGDTESKVEVASSVVDKLVTMDKINMAVGFFHSHIFLATMEKFQAYRIPVIDTCAASKGIKKKIAEKKMDYVFQLSPTTDDIIEAACKATQHYFKPKKIAILNENTDSGRDFTLFIEEWFKKNSPDAKVVYSELVTQITDYTAELAKIKASGAEIIIGEIYGAYASAFFEQWYDMRVPAMFFTQGATTMSEDFISKHSKQMEGNVANNRWWPAAYTDISLKRIEEYKKRYGKEPTNFAIQAHDGAVTAIRALEMAGSLEVDAIKTALENGTFIGIWGKKKFSSLSEGHSCSTDMVIVQIQDGKKVPIWPLNIVDKPFRPVPPWPWEM